MKISRKQLQEIIYQTLDLINEGMSKQQLDKLLTNAANDMYWTNNAEEKIIAAYESGIQKKPQLDWLVNFFIQNSENTEPIEDIIKTMKDFNRFNPTIKNLGLESDMTRYKSPSDLRGSVMRTQGKVSKIDLTSESTYLGKFGEYNLYLPHTREASCTLGEDTNWCTAVPGKGNNLFYNYVAKKNAAENYGADVFLFYLIVDKDNKNIPTEYRKMSLGYVNGEIKWAKNYDHGGGLSVTAQNNGLTEKDASDWLGSEIWDAEDAMEAYVKKLTTTGKQHPAKEKFKKLANNPALLKRELQGSSLDVKEDTLKMVRDIHEQSKPDEATMDKLRAEYGKYWSGWRELPEYMPQYPQGVKQIMYKESQKIFYKRITEYAKKAYEYQDMYSVNLMSFKAGVEHPDGDLFEERHPSVRIFEEISKQALGNSQAELLISKEYFSIIRSHGLELHDVKTNKIVQPEDIQLKYDDKTWNININKSQR